MVLWQVYFKNHPDYKMVYKELEKYAKANEVNKITMYLKGDHYIGIMKLLEDYKPKIETVKVEVEI